jgi:hypothetical protein
MVKTNGFALGYTVGDSKKSPRQAEHRAQEERLSANLARRQENSKCVGDKINLSPRP